MYCFYSVFLFIASITFSLKYPITFSTIRNLNLASSNILDQIGVQTQRSEYNIISFDGWTFNNGVKHAAQFWSNPSLYLKSKKYGVSNQNIQQSIKSIYQKRGISVLVHVFSDNQFPFFNKLDPIQTAEKLSNFVTKNNFDGVCIQILERSGIANQNNSQWILDFTKSLRNRLPQKIISYQQFPTDFLPKMAFNSIIKDLSVLIDFTIIKYYNLLQPDYKNYSSIFLNSQYYLNSSVRSLILLGLLPNQIVVGKLPSLRDDEISFVDSTILQSSFSKAYKQLGWYGGYGNNDYFTDTNGTYVNNVVSELKNLCQQNFMCI